MIKKTLSAMTIATLTLTATSSMVFAASIAPVTGVGGSRSTSKKVVMKIGDPYEVNGISYTPKENNSYDEVLIASWYGKDFQGKETANGEIFDMEALTAAHPTLPIPSIVEVTNLKNGKKVIVRINDRGPFKEGRSIDLSKRAADLLGFTEEGTAEVRVKLLPEATKIAVENMNAYKQTQDAVQVKVGTISAEENKTKSIPVTDDDLVGTDTSDNAVISDDSHRSDEDILKGSDNNQMRVVNLVEPRDVKSYIPRGVFVQLGAFSEKNNKIQSKLGDISSLGVVSLQKVDVQGDKFVRLRVGPYGSIQDAIKVKNKLVKLGYSSSRVVVQR